MPVIQTAKSPLSKYLLPQTQVPTYGQKLQSIFNQTNQPYLNTSTGAYTPNSVLGASTVNSPTNPLPTTGGQAPTGGTGNNPPDDKNKGTGIDLNALYQQGRDALNSVIPTYESDFNNYKTSVQDSIDTAQKQLNTGIDDTTQRYGTSLLNMLRTSKDLAGRTQSTFSGLGTLDSSAFGDELLKQQQADQEGTSALDLQKNKDITSMNDSFNTYQKQQQSDILAKQNELDRMKATVRQNIANNSVDEANSWINQASTAKTNDKNFLTNLALAQAQGNDVIGNLKNILGSGVDFNNLFGSNLLSRYNTGTTRYQIPSSSATGSGYIGNTVDADYVKRLLASLQ